MTRRKKQTRPSIVMEILIILSPLLLVIAILFSGFVWYQSRAIPDLHEENQQTTLPNDLSHVLGTTKETSSTLEVSLRVPIFMYHYVQPSPSNPGVQNLNIPPSVLTSQIETLKTHGYTFLTPNMLVSALLGKKKLPSKIIILSFDDGYIDDYLYVLPILQKEQVKGVFYIVPNFLDRPNYLFTFQLKELAKSPFVEIGAHTMDHTALAGLGTTQAVYEISQSRKFLQNLLHVSVNSFAYPYGSFNAATIQLVKDAGFSNAVSVIPGIVQNQENIYYLNRLRPEYRTGETLMNYLQQTTFQPW